MENLLFETGKPMPFGAHVHENGVNFSLFSRNATSVILDVFANETDDQPAVSYEFDVKKNKTGSVWHVFVQSLKPGTLYLYRVDGPFDLVKGHRFNKNTYLLDPYAKELTNDSIFKNIDTDHVPPADKMDVLLSKLQDASEYPKCVVIDDSDFDWQGDQPLNFPLRQSVLYEAHLKGFTKSKTSGVKHPGTYKGLIEKIPYLKELGVTSIELLPVQEFDELENSNINPKNGKPLKNFWGYSTIGFFAPKASYATDKSPGGAVREFKEMVRELHKNNLEVILDIVFNHTAEGNEKGVTINLRGLENSVYYILEDHDKGKYKNYSGCGNTLNCNHPVVRTLIIDSLRYWVTEMHVDGFRFDLGSILGRDRNGNLMENPPMLERIAEDPVLANTKIIAEAWDAGGAYQVGWFPGGRWAEWNDRYRDDVRRFFRGDGFLSAAAATRLTGSSDLYLRDGRKPFHSVNFITSHDGFTLNDLVSYNTKRNEENGEDNRDGTNNNHSYNYGYEGKTSITEIEEVRSRQIKNMLLFMTVSQGTPMILAGDEFRRSQGGNNNAYCQDNKTSWINWKNRDTYSDIFRFTQKAISFRLRHPAFRRPEFFCGQDLFYNSLPDIAWFDQNGRIPDWQNLNQFLACYINGIHAEKLNDMDDNDFYLMFNTSQHDIRVTLPKPLKGKKWFRVVDTSLPCPHDFLLAGEEKMVQPQTTYFLPARSSGVLLSKVKI
ncbi:MAG TPA: glycogen debranching protein GlgX [Treponemataceae bacterium]|nr:glycogen debranching protein GlgX [Treponemataceae bacterium]